MRLRPFTAGHLWILLFGLGLPLFSGCQLIPAPAADPTRFYVLTGPGLAESPPPASGTLRLGLKAIELPAYLRSRSLIVRQGASEIVYDDYARWAEALDSGLSRVLRAQLIATPEVLRVYPHPFPFDRERDYDVSIQVIRCEGIRSPEGNVVRFAAVVELTDARSGDVISRHVFNAPNAGWDGRDYEALVGALSEAAGRLATDVVANLPKSQTR